MALKGLLPAGFQDALAPQAEVEAETIDRLMKLFGACDYQRVEPPLLEFEDSLLTGPGAALAPQTMRLMDPVSQRMMAIRADMTPQIARIAVSRLANAPRPLRLCYAGPVVRVRGSQLRPERQFAQAGLELIGAAGVAADAEVIGLAAESLSQVGIEGLSIDLTMPGLVPAYTENIGYSDDSAGRIRLALDRKDAAALRLAAPDDTTVLALLKAAGRAETAMATLRRLQLGAAAARLVEHLGALIGHLAQSAPGLTLTVDPAEFRGFEYQEGICFTLFARDIRGELGRGGRYRLDSGETAIGFSVYLDSVMRALPAPRPRRRIFIAASAASGDGAALRGAGWATVAGLDQVASDEVEARRQGCSHLWRSGKIVSLDA